MYGIYQAARPMITGSYTEDGMKAVLKKSKINEVQPQYAVLPIMQQ